MNPFDVYLQGLVGFLQVTEGCLGGCDLSVAFKHFSVQILYLENSQTPLASSQTV